MRGLEQRALFFLLKVFLLHSAKKDGTTQSLQINPRLHNNPFFAKSKIIKSGSKTFSYKENSMFNKVHAANLLKIQKSTMFDFHHPHVRIKCLISSKSHC